MHWPDRSDRIPGPENKQNVYCIPASLYRLAAPRLYLPDGPVIIDGRNVDDTALILREEDFQSFTDKAERAEYIRIATFPSSIFSFMMIPPVICFLKTV